MAQCEVCGNDYDKTFTVIRLGKTHVFDCLECAIEVLAPRCAHCGIKVVGHGLEDEESYYCCAHCFRARTTGHVRAATIQDSTGKVPAASIRD